MPAEPNRHPVRSWKPCQFPGCSRTAHGGNKYCLGCESIVRSTMARQGYLTYHLERSIPLRERGATGRVGGDATPWQEDAIRALEGD
jgi:hypothetical protein